jgi:hypothetical protein
VCVINGHDLVLQQERCIGETLGKAFMFFAFVWIMLSVLAGISQGGGGVVQASLTANVSSVATTIPVASTSNFPTKGDVYIGDEKITYYNTTTTTFIGTASHALERGAGDTTATIHAKKSIVYTAETNALKGLTKIEIAKVSDSSGIWKAVMLGSVIFEFMGRFLVLPLLFVGADMAIPAYLAIGIALSFIFTVGLYMAGSRRIV